MLAQKLSAPYTKDLQFLFFSQLPKKIRLMLWWLAALGNARLIQLHTVLTSAPTTLRVCQESP